MTETGQQIRKTGLPRVAAAGEERSARPWLGWRAKIRGAAGRWRPPRRMGPERLVAVVLLLAACVVRTLDPAPVEMLRIMVFDLYQTVRPREVAQHPVVIVDIDEESLSALGQWPWPRTILADMVGQLTRLGAAAIGFDVIFPESDRMSPERVAEALPDIDEATAAALRRMPGNDTVFAHALSRSRTVLGQSVQPGIVAGAEENPPLKTPVAQIGGDPRPYLRLRYASLVRNVPVLEKAASGRGIILPAPERDGVVRRVPAIFQVGEALFPSLAIEMLRVATGQSAYAVKSNSDGITSIVVAGVQIPTDERGRIWIHFAPHDRGRYVSAKEVLAGAVTPERVGGKLVLVGSSASGLLDIRATPLGVSMPGVEIHAQLLENILSSTYLSRPAYALGVELAITLLAGLLMIALLPRLGARWTLLLFALVVAGSAVGSWYLYTGDGVLIDVTYAAIITFVIYSFLTYTSYVRAEAQRQQVRNAFSRYLSPAMVEQLAAEPGRLHLGGEDRFMTLLFCDVQDFTTIAEHFDARSLTRLINRFFTPMTEVILKWQGTVDKYMGDCVMAFWNAPLDDPAHARNACLAALEMQARLTPLNEELKAEAESNGELFLPIEIGVGVNSGMCMVGNLGSEQRFDYSVLGDTVNVASRLEGQTRTYRVRIVIGESVYEQEPGLAILELDLIRVVGKTVPERIYTLLGDESVAASEAFRGLKAEHEQMLVAYRGQNWEAAQEALDRCRQRDPGLGLGALYDMFERRIAAFQASPPSPDWDGVHVATSK